MGARNIHGNVRKKLQGLKKKKSVEDPGQVARDAAKADAMAKVLAAPKVVVDDPLAGEDLSRFVRKPRGAARDMDVDEAAGEGNGDEEVPLGVSRESRLGLYNNKKKNKARIQKKKREGKMKRMTKVRKARKHGLMNVKME